MRTTVDLPDELYRRAKAEAALRGARLRDLVEEGLRHVLDSPPEKEAPRRVSFPILRSNRPGSMSLEAIRKAEEQSYMDEDESRAGALRR